MSKDIGVIIEFDNVKYSDEERNLLWWRFALFLAEAAEELKGEKNAKCSNIAKYGNKNKFFTKN